MREEFEKLPEIAVRLDGICWNDDLNIYQTEYPILFNAVGFINGAWCCFQEKQKKIDVIKKMIVSLRNEFDLWSDGTESFNAIEAQIENLEELLK